MNKPDFWRKHPTGFVVFDREGVDIEHGCEYYTTLEDLKIIYRSYNRQKPFSNGKLVVCIDDLMWKEAPKKKRNSYLVYSSDRRR